VRYDTLMLIPLWYSTVVCCAVMWTDLMWLLDYLPSSDDRRRFNIALGSGGTFDWCCY